MKVLFNRKIVYIKIDRILQDYNDETFQNLIGITTKGRKFHIVRMHENRQWELIDSSVYN